jgi:hypothetical protein
MAHTSHYALRLLTFVKAEAEKWRPPKGPHSISSFTSPLPRSSPLRTVQFFQECGARADLATFDRLLTRAGNEPPRPGNEIDDDPRRALRTRKPPVRPKRSVRPSAKRTA